MSVMPDERGEFYLMVRTRCHEYNGYPGFPDTDSGGPGLGYTCIMWFEPGTLFLGMHSGSSCPEGVRVLHSGMWGGHHPTDFTTLKVVLIATEWPHHTPRVMHTYSIPIVWLTDPVPTTPSTWGGVKSLYE